MNWTRVLVGSLIALGAIAASSRGPVIWWGAVVVGGWIALTGFAGPLQRVVDAIDSKVDSPAYLDAKARERYYKPLVPALKATFTREEWEDEVMTRQVTRGILEDWRVAELIIKERLAAVDAEAAALDGERPEGLAGAL